MKRMRNATLAVFGSSGDVAELYVRRWFQVDETPRKSCPEMRLLPDSCKVAQCLPIAGENSPSHPGTVLGMMGISRQLSRGSHWRRFLQRRFGTFEPLRAIPGGTPTVFSDSVAFSGR